MCCHLVQHSKFVIEFVDTAPTCAAPGGILYLYYTFSDVGVSMQCGVGCRVYLRRHTSFMHVHNNCYWTILLYCVFHGGVI